MLEAPVRYVTQTPEGGWRIAGSRVSLDSVVRLYRDGTPPNAIAAAFPSLSLEQVHGAIAFYLRHQETIDHHLEEQGRRWEELRIRSESENGPLLDRLRATGELRNSLGRRERQE